MVVFVIVCLWPCVCDWALVDGFAVVVVAVRLGLCLCGRVVVVACLWLCVCGCVCICGFVVLLLWLCVCG